MENAKFNLRSVWRINTCLEGFVRSIVIVLALHVTKQGMIVMSVRKCIHVIIMVSVLLKAMSY